MEKRAHVVPSLLTRRADEEKKRELIGVDALLEECAESLKAKYFIHEMIELEIRSGR